MPHSGPERPAVAPQRKPLSVCGYKTNWPGRCPVNEEFRPSGFSRAGAGAGEPGRARARPPRRNRCQRVLRTARRVYRFVMASENTARLAVLIDADNAQPSITEALLAEVAKYGTAHVKRAYGDWTGTNLKGWKDQLLAQSIQPIQQFAYTKGKNSTDAAMVIDAMDLLYSGRFDGFCIVSSDSDFTRLAARLRESGLTVYGFGERKTPKPFVAACDKFIYIENLRFADDPAADTEAKPARRAPATAAQLKADTALVNLLRNAVEAASDDDGWAPLSAVGNIITNQRPDFDSRSYGYAKLSDVIKATTLFTVERRGPGDGKQAIMYAREKRRQAARRSATGKTAAAGGTANGKTERTPSDLRVLQGRVSLPCGAGTAGRPRRGPRRGFPRGRRPRSAPRGRRPIPSRCAPCTARAYSDHRCERLVRGDRAQHRGPPDRLVGEERRPAGRTRRVPVRRRQDPGWSPGAYRPGAITAVTRLGRGKGRAGGRSRRRGAGSPGSPTRRCRGTPLRRRCRTGRCSGQPCPGRRRRS
jgi:uncharacterized LabA/DUF88 family protein